MATPTVTVTEHDVTLIDLADDSSTRAAALAELSALADPDRADALAELAAVAARSEALSELAALAG